MQSRDATIWHSASSPVPSEVAPSVDILQPMKAFDIDDRMGASGASKLAKLEVGGQSTTACSLSERFTIYSKRLPGSGQTHILDTAVGTGTCLAVLAHAVGSLAGRQVPDFCTLQGAYGIIPVLATLLFPAAWIDDKLFFGGWM